MPLLKRKKVSQLPIPSPLTTLPPATARRAFLANGHGDGDVGKGVIMDSPQPGPSDDPNPDPDDEDQVDPEHVVDILEPLKARLKPGEVLHVGRWVEPEVYWIPRTGEVFATYE